MNVRLPRIDSTFFQIRVSSVTSAAWMALRSTSYDTSFSLEDALSPHFLAIVEFVADSPSVIHCFRVLVHPTQRLPWASLCDACNGIAEHLDVLAPLCTSWSAQLILGILASLALQPHQTATLQSTRHAGRDTPRVALLVSPHSFHSIDYYPVADVL